MPAAAAAHLATLNGPEQHRTQRAYCSTLRALTAQFAPSGTPFTVAELDTEENVAVLTDWFGTQCATSRTTAPPSGTPPWLMHSNATYRGRANILKRPEPA